MHEHTILEKEKAAGQPPCFEFEQRIERFLARLFVELPASVFDEFEPRTVLRFTQQFQPGQQLVQ